MNMNRRNIARSVLSLTVGFVGLMSWIAPADHAAVRPITARFHPGAQQTPPGNGSWRRIGPDEEIQSLAIDPSNPNFIYAGLARALLRSTNGGTTWDTTALPIDANIYNGGQFVTVVLVIDSANPKILYAGIQEPRGCLHSDRRLFKSVDGGASWSNSLSPPINGCDNIHALASDPTNSSTIYLANYDDAFGDTWSPLVKSDDGGASWTPLYGPPFSVLAVNPRNPTTLYAGTFDFPYYGYGGWDYRTGVLKSTDGGAHWGTTDLSNTGVSVLAIDPVNPSVLYAGTSGFGGYPSHPMTFRGLFKSIDSGTSWSAINNGLADLVGKVPSITALAVDPNNPNKLYAGTSGRGVFSSLDAGATWSEFNAGLTNLNINALAIDESGQRFYAATGAGVFEYVVQSGAPVRINSATASGKKLFVTGENFDPGAVILLNGESQKTLFDNQNPRTALIGKNAGKRIKPGDKLQVQNPNGAVSEEFIFTG